MGFTKRGAEKKLRQLLDAGTIHDAHAVERIITEICSATRDGDANAPDSVKLAGILWMAVKARLLGEATEDVFRQHIRIVLDYTAFGAPDDVELPDVLEGVV
ncbi:MAG TPA: hypothetical protein VLB83_00865 [Candidatus Paceibacterota bacterium]|nr:hypothetical protein [Candidatus Paceibacterota bacterium]